MNKWIISTWKRNYRSIRLKNPLLDIETHSQRKEWNKGLNSGLKGISEVYDPHLLDVSKIVKESGNKASEMKVASCWIKYKILPMAMETKLSTTYGRMRNDRIELVKSMMDGLKKLFLSTSTNDAVLSKISLDVDESTIERWVTIENDPII